jgi:hypothetical protein
MHAYILVALAFDPIVQQEISRMDSPNFLVREAATKKAASFGIRGLWPLREAAESHPSEEVRRRCSVAIELINEDLNSYWRVYPTNYPMKSFPKIGFLAATNHPQAEATTFKYLLAAGKQFRLGQTYEKDVERASTSNFVKDLLLAGTARDDVQVLINAMTEHERQWWLRHRPEKMPAELREKK